jgi:hypothetical protein
MPANHIFYNEQRGFDADYFLKQSKKIGPFTEEFVWRLLGSKDFIEQTYNACLGVHRLAKKTPIDDFGLAPLTQDVKLALLQILEDRYGRKATIIASQIPVEQWYDYIDEPTIADAILDRIIPKAHRFDLKGSSLRNRK